MFQLNESLHKAKDQIFALIACNYITAERGFDLFDIDEDGMVSFLDLTNAVKTMELDIDEPTLAAVFDHLDVNKAGHIPRHCWKDALAFERRQESLDEQKVLVAVNLIIIDVSYHDFNGFPVVNWY